MYVRWVHGISKPIPVALSSASVFPGTTYDAFHMAADLGYDAIEVMVGQDPVSQDPQQWLALTQRFGVAVTSVHAPVLLVTQSVWGTDGWEKVRRTVAAAEEVGAGVVVLHPPFRWQFEYAKRFEERLHEEQAHTRVLIAVENMFPWGRVRGYAPSDDIRKIKTDNVVIDLSHTAASHIDPLELLDDVGDRLVHVHLADGSGAVRDEHLIPGRGSQPVARFLERLVETRYQGSVVVEVSTRSATSYEGRREDLREALSFARNALDAAHSNRDIV